MADEGSFFRLHPEIRNCIYEQVLVVAYTIFLFQDKDGQLEIFAPKLRRNWLALLQTSQRMNRETTAMAYGSNRFALADKTKVQPALLQSFLGRIGPVNASLIRHMRINFPVVDTDNMFQKDMDDRLTDHILRLLQERCTNLSTLEMLVHRENSLSLAGKHRSEWDSMREALLRIDARLKAFESLKTIIVRSYNRAPYSPAVEVMRELGWVVLRKDAKYEKGSGNKTG